MEAKGHVPPGSAEAMLAYPDELPAHERDASDEPDAKRPRGGADGLAPMTREEHARQLADAEAQLEAAAAAEEAAAAAAAEEARQQEAASEASRLDAILSQIDGAPAAADPADPLADFLRSVDSAGALSDLDDLPLSQLPVPAAGGREAVFYGGTDVRCYHPRLLARIRGREAEADAESD